MKKRLFYREAWRRIPLPDFRSSRHRLARWTRIRWIATRVAAAGSSVTALNPLAKSALHGQRNAWATGVFSVGIRALQVAER